MQNVGEGVRKMRELEDYLGKIGLEVSRYV